jgi:ATP-dependent protease Clp ATPase subunit
MEKTTPTSGPKILPTPAEMIAYLDRFVQGQEQAKQLLSRAVYFHYLPDFDSYPQHSDQITPQVTDFTKHDVSLR